MCDARPLIVYGLGWVGLSPLIAWGMVAAFGGTTDPFDLTMGAILGGITGLLWPLLVIPAIPAAIFLAARNVPRIIRERRESERQALRDRVRDLERELGVGTEARW